ncbi:MAG: FliA/WhiG family RNA polymerase sigma factor [Deltaproteobacteria bacterium]|nr:FliA/WhiG family RNA polymerase sigma factor [Candidatus Anaeroferrophillus wilburensis]MBN2889595.1 FliA/WhiG family RNA polymerase sigma factor [Deltaproteobacteria bacterium]
MESLLENDGQSQRDDGAQALVVEYLPLIQRIAQRIASRLPDNVDINDLVNSGVIGLIDAISKFDPSRQIKFKTYAEIRVRGAILDELRAQDWASRSLRSDSNLLENTYSYLEQKFGRPPEDEEVAESLGVSMEDFYKLLGKAKGISLINFEDMHFENGEELRDPYEFVRFLEGDDPFALFKDKELHTFLVESIDQLPERERLVLSLYYFEDLNLKEIGMILGVSESRVCQLRTKAIIHLKGKTKRARMAKQKGQSYES